MNKILLYILLILVAFLPNERAYSAKKLTRAQWREIRSASEPPAWSKNFRKAEITHDPLLNFIRGQLIPLFKNAPVDEGENRIYITFYRDSTYNAPLKNEKVEIHLSEDDTFCQLDMNSPETDSPTYMTEIDGLTVFITDACMPDAKSDWINVLQSTMSPNPKYWKMFYYVKDMSASWFMTLSDNEVSLDSIIDWGLDFIEKGTPRWKYIPLKKIENPKPADIPPNILDIDIAAPNNVDIPEIRIKP